ncbi:MAG: phosphodiesterase, MJ0936 family protein [Candidatus Moranbacteria bacterium GW2011_GWA2_39_41]|nr:MAG: phosphodiesterase, MJ0936 family protein [Candidatus Moranbacteria bacterium GW2011_GWA2_39_41]
MRIAIISDIHNNETNLKKVLDFCAQNYIEKIICCGDLATQETLEFFCDNFASEIFYVFGNMDREQMNMSAFKHISKSADGSIKYKNAFVYENFGEIQIAGKEIAFIHFPREAKELAETGKYDFVFFGHTHKPWTEVVGSCTMINPGNATGDFYPPTFATWNTETGKFELKRIHDLK